MNKNSEIIKRLLEHYPNPKTPLLHKNTWELLIAVILSAQTTDVLVNKLTPTLFNRYSSPAALAQADLGEVEKLIKGVNYFKTKAKNIIKTSKIIVDQYEGEVPDSMDALVTLAGVGRKTANVIISEAFNKPVGVVVDTHVKRLSNRLGFTKEQTPEKIEQDLMNQFPKEHWRELSLALIYHGRKTCFARKPDCKNCFLNDICPSAFKCD